jgi:hypothetical protein
MRQKRNHFYLENKKSFEPYEDKKDKQEKQLKREKIASELF